MRTVDEGDVLIPTDFPDAFFSYLRSWCDKRGGFNEQWQNFNLILVISTEASFLIKNLAHSAFFNVATSITTRDFDEEQVRHLNRQYQHRLKEADFKDFMALLGGHPFLTRMALFKLLTAQNLTWATMTSKADHEDGPFGFHLRYYHKLLNGKTTLQQGLLNVITNQSCADENVLYTLMQAGLVKKKPGRGYICRCGLYSRYFEDKLR